MTFRAGLGLSKEASVFAAGCAAAKEAQAALGVLEPRLAIVLATPGYDQTQLVEGVRSLTHTTPLIGGSTPLLITARGLCTQGAAVLLLGADDVTCTVGSTPMDGAGNGAALTASLTSSGEARTRRALLLLAHPRTTLSPAWLQATQRAVGAHVPLAGGVLAANHRHRAALSCDDTSAESGVVGALLSGALQVGVGTAHGWHPIGAPRRATRVEGCVVRTINGAPAAGLYREYFGETAVQQITGETLPRMTATYPLGITGSARAPRPLLRSVERIQEDGSLACLGDVPPEAWVRLMIASRQSVLDAAARAASLAISRLRQAQCALVLESAARHRVLGAHAAEEVPALQRVLGAQTPFIGGLTQAEIAPHLRGVQRMDAEMHNASFTVIALGW